MGSNFCKFPINSLWVDWKSCHGCFVILICSLSGLHIWITNKLITLSSCIFERCYWPGSINSNYCSIPFDIMCLMYTDAKWTVHELDKYTQLQFHIDQRRPNHCFIFLKTNESARIPENCTHTHTQTTALLLNTYKFEVLNGGKKSEPTDLRNASKNRCVIWCSYCEYHDDRILQRSLYLPSSSSGA